MYLLRHAKSTREYPELPDFERPLLTKGRNDIGLMADFIRKNKLFPELMISSPACRALATARILAELTNYSLNKILVDEEIYEAWTDDITKILNKVNDDYSSVMIVGHNPGLQQFAQYLQSFPYENLPTCGLLQFTLKVNSWKEIERGCGEITLYQTPKKLLGIN
ncbi:MAG: SixA phosphatase family protein [Bacteroidia bacterium]